MRDIIIKAPLRCKRCKSTNVTVTHQLGRVGSTYTVRPMVVCDDCHTVSTKGR